MMNLIDVLRRANQNPKKLFAVLSSSRNFLGWDSLNHLVQDLNRFSMSNFSTSDIIDDDFLKLYSKCYQ